MAVKRSVRLTVEWRGHRKGSILELDTGLADGLIRSGYALPVSDEVPRDRQPALLTRKRRGTGARDQGSRVGEKPDGEPNGLL